MSGLCEPGAGGVTTPGPAVRVLLGPTELEEELRADMRRALSSTPKDLPPKWFYDERGSELFGTITTLEEYYPTRREREILGARADDIARLTRVSTLVELGAGSADKTRVLLDAFGAGLARYVAFDVCEEATGAACTSLCTGYPALDVRGVVGDFERHLHLLPRWDRQLVAFLGGTIGNLRPEPRARFLSQLRSTMAEGDWLLLGADLVKAPGRLLAAYDDAAGVTAEFNRNVLRVLNRRLGCNFRPDRFHHVAAWDAEAEWVEMRLRADGEQQVSVPALDTAARFDDGEEMRTEVSAKFRRAGLETELAAAGFELARWWTDDAGDFSLSLARAGAPT